MNTQDKLDDLYSQYNNATSESEKSALAKKIADERAKQQFRTLRESVQNKLTSELE